MNFHPVKRRLLKKAMPIYQYHVVNGKQPQEIFEVEQKIDDPPLTEHPLTFEPVKRAFISPSLSLKHTSENEKKSLCPDNLKNHGFSKYEKDSSGEYFRTLGDQGPTKISPNILD